MFPFFEYYITGDPACDFRDWKSQLFWMGNFHSIGLQRQIQDIVGTVCMQNLYCAILAVLTLYITHGLQDSTYPINLVASYLCQCKSVISGILVKYDTTVLPG